MIIGFSCFLFFIDDKTDKESEHTINFSEFSLAMISSARSMALVSALNIEASFGSRFLIVMLLQVAAHPTLSLSLDPSVYTYV